MSNVPAILIDKVSYRYMSGTPFETLALDQVSLSIMQGERVALVGHTGSGKSTLAGLCNGILKPTEGVVRIFGKDTKGPPSEQKNIRIMAGYVMQNPEDQLFEEYVGDDIAFGSLKMGLSLSQARERVRFAMEQVGLDFSEKDRPIYTLSRGRKRLVAIAGILAMEPDILILDEPTSGLDPESGAALLETLYQLNQSRGTTLFIITHQLSEVFRIANRVIVMGDTRVLLDKDPEDLFSPMEQAPEGLLLPDEVLIAQKLLQYGVVTTRNEWTGEGFASAFIRSLKRQVEGNGGSARLE